ncbi:GNAT family N-acetyltransferase [Streptomyces sp. NPDC085866]|uniref:GNAT family N-acetyltransferase n=1 Tax=Streptomyces sp. NPDC085866 TaxID=3365736 RepID=UPI0037CE6267
MTEPVSAEQVAALRRFNRCFTRRIGALDDHYLGQDRPLGEARLVFEIGEGASLRELRNRLGLDAGYLSRTAKALEGQGMVRVEAPPDQRAELTDAMATAQRLLRLAAITVRAVDSASAVARACLEAYAADIDARFPEGFDSAALVRPEEVTGDAGAFLVAYEEARPVGCGALRRLEPGVGEIRHVRVHAEARRPGLARRLLDGLEREARARGLDVVRLDTHAVLTEAQALYRACGYTEIPRYDDNVHAGHWFEKRLVATG